MSLEYGNQTAQLEDELDEKKLEHDQPYVVVGAAEDRDRYAGDLGDVELQAKHDLMVTGDDLNAIEDQLNTLSVDRTLRIMRQMYEMHKHDQNFSDAALEKMHRFITDPDIEARPEKHEYLINEMKLEALLVTTNSPYAEVRANVEPTDDPTLPVFTLRAWIIGIVFSGAGAFINQLFSVRYPSVSVSANVAQLLAYPWGKFMARVLPDYRFRLMGTEHSLNPGPFNRKEHMLITIMANVAFNTPYTGYIILVQAMPVYFNQAYAYKFSYQILSTIGCNFLGYGLAGITRRFIVFPSFCIWPNSLSTVALLKAFHTETNEPVAGPFGRTYTWSREKFFMIWFFAMFFYWFFPGYIFGALSTFSWITWISPNNALLSQICGFNEGLGINPWPTFDYNIAAYNGYLPMVLPTFVIVNLFIGLMLSFFIICGWYYSNAWNTGYLPINSNKLFANTGGRYHVAKILNSEGHFDNEKYQNYSEPWMAAGNLINYFFFFAGYAATIVYTALYHRHELKLGFTGFWHSLRKSFKRGGSDHLADEGEDDLAEDVHYKLMLQYKEVPEWWYLTVLAVSGAIGMIGVGVFPTYTSPVVVVYGAIMALICVIPIGIIASVTGIQVTMNVMAEFIGGCLVEGNAIALNFFKMYGYVTTASALFFANDLKLAHYVKIPPRYTFWAQMIATLVSTFVCTAIFNFQMGFKNACTSEADFGFICPGQNTFFTAAVFWGTLSPKRLFGPGARYNLLLLGFPVGIAIPLIHYGMRRAFPKSTWIRQLHPVMITQGALAWAPYNFSFFIPGLYITLVSWQFVRKRYLAFWSKYNFVLASAWSAGIAISAIVIFFALEIPKNGTLAIGGENGWWGNNIVGAGCEGNANGCPRLTVDPNVGYFGPAPGTNSFM